MKTVLLLVALVNSGLAFGFADEVQPTAGAPAAVPADEQQVIVVEAWRRDRALDAFLRGDFATAEVEFRKNVQCIRRQELQFDYALRQQDIDMYRAYFAGTNRAPSIHNLPQRPPQEIAERTCYSKEWQIYMIGLSQIQLGRFAEAKKSLTTVTHMSNEDTLFDAHYRVGLLDLLEGDVEGANRRLTHLIKMNRSCQARSRCEVGPDLEAATDYLTRAVANARQGVSR